MHFKLNTTNLSYYHFYFRYNVINITVSFKIWSITVNTFPRCNALPALWPDSKTQSFLSRGRMGSLGSIQRTHYFLYRWDWWRIITVMKYRVCVSLHEWYSKPFSFPIKLSSLDYQSVSYIESKIKLPCQTQAPFNPFISDFLEIAFQIPQMRKRILLPAIDHCWRRKSSALLIKCFFGLNYTVREFFTRAVFDLCKAYVPDFSKWHFDWIFFQQIPIFCPTAWVSMEWFSSSYKTTSGLLVSRFSNF